MPQVGGNLSLSLFFLHKNRIFPQAESIPKSHSETAPLGKQPSTPQIKVASASSNMSCDCATPHGCKPQVSEQKCHCSVHNDGLTRVRPHRQLALHWSSTPLTHPEPHCREVVLRPKGKSAETFSPQFPERGAKEWRGQEERGDEGTLFLETNSNPASPKP